MPSYDPRDVEPLLFKLFSKVATEVLRVENVQIVASARFVEDLGVDSLHVVELVMGLEDEFDVRIDSDELEYLDTLGSVYAMVVDKL